MDDAQSHGDAARPKAFGRLRAAIARRRSLALIGAVGGQNVLRLASNLVLTRILAPEIFGAVGVILSISYVLAMLADMGIQGFVVRARDGENRRFLDVIWTLRVIRNVGLTGLMFAFAGPMALAFDKPDLAGPIRIASFLFLLEGARSLYPFIAERQRRVAYVSAVELLSVSIQLAATIVAALITRSIWGPIAGLYFGAALNVVFSYAFYRGGAHRFVLDPRIANELWRFARVIIPTSVITLILGQADKVLIGRSMTLEAFGLYILAANFAAAGRQLVWSWSSRVLYTAFAEAARRTPEAVADIFYLSRRRLSLLLAFAFGFGVGAGVLIARLLFDDRYLSSGLYISLLFLVPLFSLATLPSEAAMIAVGRVKSALEANLIRLAWIIVAAPIGLSQFGVPGLVAAFASIEAPAAIFWWLRLKSAGIFNLREEGFLTAAGLCGAALGWGVQSLVERLLREGALPAF